MIKISINKLTIVREEVSQRNLKKNWKKNNNRRKHKHKHYLTKKKKSLLLLLYIN